MKNKINIQTLLGIIIIGIFVTAFIYGTILTNNITPTAMIIFPSIAVFMIIIMISSVWIKFFRDLKAPWMGADGYLPYACNSRPYRSNYDNVLNYCEQINKDEYIFYKVIKIPMINKFIKRTYRLKNGISTKISNPGWMDFITTCCELKYPTPTNVPVYPYLGYKVITKFSQDNIHIIELSNDIDQELYIYFNSYKGWRRVFDHEISQILDQSADIMKMEWNIYQACH